MAAETLIGGGRLGSVALATLCLVTALGVAVASYFALLTHTQRQALRQFQNDRARELAENGLEEALWALNQNNWTGSGPANSTAWSTSGANRTVALNYGSLGQGASGQVALTVANYASAGPVWPTITAVATVTLTDGRVATKTLQATTTPAPLFGHALASANASVSFTAGGTVDSWNSDPDNNPLTPAVPYTFIASAPANYAATIAGRDNGSGYGVVLTQALVRGYVATHGLPVAYSTSASPPGRVKGPATAAGVEVDPTRLARTAFVPASPVFAVTLPSTSGSNYGGLVFGVLQLVTNLVSALLGIDLYKTSGDLDIRGNLLYPSLTVNRPLKLIVTGDFIISGSGKITITPTGSLELYVLGDCSIGGNGIDNQNDDPASCAIFCTSASTTDTLQYTTGGDFCGVIYCENKPIDIRQNATFYGALLSKQQVTFSAAATAPVFHYDTALATTRFQHVTTPYVIKQLTEP